MAKLDMRSKSKPNSEVELDPISKSQDKISGSKSKRTKNRSSKNKKFQNNKHNSSSKQVKVGSFNDVSWYEVSPEITNPAANIPFNLFNGVPFNIYDKDISRLNSCPQNQNVPGVLIYKYLPWYGNSDETSALNVAMRGLFAYLRKANSGKTNYEAPDLMQYIMAMDSIYLRIHEIRRALKLVAYYNGKNRTIPEQLFNGMNIDLTSAVIDYNNCRGIFNTIISMVNSLAVPAEFTLFNRRAVLASSIMSDESERGTQIIMAVSDGYWRYNPTGKTGGKFDYVPYYKVYTTKDGSATPADGPTCLRAFRRRSVYSELLELYSDLNLLLANQDINIMAGDIMKAYEGNVHTLPYLSENESIEFIYDYNLLQQIRHATVLDIQAATYGWHFNWEQNDITRAWDHIFLSDSFIWFKDANGRYSPIPTINQENNSLVCKVFYSKPSAPAVNTVYTDSYSSASIGAINKLIVDTNVKPEPGLLVEWSRLMMLVDKTNSGIEATLDGKKGKTTIYELLAGTEIGLGFLYVLGDYREMPLIKETSIKFEPYAGVAQWYQRGIPRDIKYSLARDEIHEIDTIAYYGVERYLKSVENINTWIPTNNIYVDECIKGFTYKPRSYGIASYNLTSDAEGLRYISTFDTTSPGMSMGNDTAIIDSNTLRGLHDVAILGLLAKSFVRG